MSSRQSPKSVFDTDAAKSIRAWTLLYGGEYAGRIVVGWSRSGGTARAFVGIHKGPLADSPSLHGRAGGYGYDKASAAIGNAFDRWVDGKCVSANVEHAPNGGPLLRWEPIPFQAANGTETTIRKLASIHGEGTSAVQEQLETLGYEMHSIL